MVKNFFVAIFLAIVVFVGDAFLGNYGFLSTSTCAAPIQMAPTNGDQYTRTGKKVHIYTEMGICKGAFDVYLHRGKKYISFQNTWICIQGKSRFGFNGNWYIIK